MKVLNKGSFLRLRGTPIRGGMNSTIPESYREDIEALISQGWELEIVSAVEAEPAPKPAPPAEPEPAPEPKAGVKKRKRAQPPPDSGDAEPSD